MKTNETIFSYNDYRAFLKDQIQFRRESGKVQSVRQIARVLGFKAPSHFAMILQGERRLPVRYLPSIIKFLQLKQAQASYFEALVQLNDAKSVLEKEFYAAKLKKNHPEHIECAPMDLELFRYISNPLHLFLMELVSFEKFKDDPEWIQSQLDPHFSLSDIAEAFDRLLKLGLIKRDGGRLIKTNKFLSTTTDVPNAYIKNAHDKLLDLSRRSLIKHDTAARDIGATTIAIKLSKLYEAKKMIRDFRQTIMKYMADDESDAIYQLNVQFFPITKTTNSYFANKKEKKDEK